MRGNHLVREARRRASITQTELAERVGTTQSVVARVEADVTGSSLEYLSRLVWACGYELEVRLAPSDEHDWTIAARSLTLTPSERVTNLKNAVRFAAAGRQAGRASPRGGSGR